MADTIPKLISLLLPTRARPGLARRFLETAFETCLHPEQVEIIMVVDDDDATYEGFESPFARTSLFSVPLLTMSDRNRFAADNSSGEILAFVNDDIVVESNAWDVVIRDMHAKYLDAIYLAYPNDGFKGAKLATFPILSRFTYKSFDVLPTIYSGAFIDTHLHETFLNLQGFGEDRICYLADIKFTHLHYRVTKDAQDETYKRRDRFGDDLTFLQNVKVRCCVSLKMRHYIRTGDRFSASGSADVLDGIMAPFSYYLFACPGHISYRLGVIFQFLLRLTYSKLTA